MAFHINKGLVGKYMNSLLIGELSPEQPSFEPTKNVRPCGDGGAGGRRQASICSRVTTVSSSCKS